MYQYRIYNLNSYPITYIAKIAHTLMRSTTCSCFIVCSLKHLVDSKRLHYNRGWFKCKQYLDIWICGYIHCRWYANRRQETTKWWSDLILNTFPYILENNKKNIVSDIMIDIETLVKQINNKINDI